jgi:putative lipoic acid-binding regulatory protein
VILDNFNQNRPEIEYPCEWKYKIISQTADDAVEAAEDAAKGFKYEITSSNISKKGKYVSINLAVEVETEAERNLIFGKLEADDKVIMVI